ncbi:hypothetical protein AB4453_04525 [Vibrio atlanticus]|uniref:hypothetical protein n=1 Tax=Vibrio atlanticus TaxID=693153 RepID=UPI00354DF70C
MFFTIAPQIFSQSNIDMHNLNKVWSVCTEQHTFYLSDFDALEAIEASDWHQGLSVADQKLLEESFVKSMEMNNGQDNVKVAIGDTHTAFEAFQYLNSPLKIILENSRNDAHFLQAIFRCFRQDTKKIKEHIDNRWIQFVMGGGSSIEQVIETEKDSFNAPSFTKDKSEYLRCFVLLDSDKTYSTEPLKDGLNNLVAFLDRNNVPFHILEKREMENYIPDIAFGDVTENRPYIEAYLRFTAEQKDYFDLEKGFRNVNFDALPVELQTLFSTVDAQDKAIFRRNNMKNFTNSGREDFKTECPKLFNLECVDRASLISRTQYQQNPNELKEIIQKIRELL